MRSIRTKILLIVVASAIISFVICTAGLWVYVSLIPDSVVDTVSDEVFYRTVAIVVLIYVSAIIITFILFTMFFLNLFITKRIKHLEEQTNEVIKGNYEDNIDMNQKDEIGNLAKTYKIMLKELRNNEYLSKSFIRNYSHELKTPLSSISGYATLIKDTNDEKKINEYAEIIQYESKRLATMSVDLLKISELDSKDIIPQNDQTNITEMLRDIILLTEPIWSSKELELDLNLEEITYTTNDTLMYTALFNLVTNAFKYAPDSTIVSITLSKSESLQFSITNEGDLSEEQKENLYALFYTTDKNKSRRSSGVGLALVNRIVKKLHANIKCNTLNNKITFTINF